jgi:hypothetical protein
MAQNSGYVTVELQPVPVRLPAGQHVVGQSVFGPGPTYLSDGLIHALYSRRHWVLSYSVKGSVTGSAPGQLTTMVDTFVATKLDRRRSIEVILSHGRVVAGGVAKTADCRPQEHRRPSTLETSTPGT